MFAATVAALCLATSANADPPNDCGAVLTYPGAGGTTTFCGEYPNPNGSALICACDEVSGGGVGRECVDSNNDVNKVGPDGLQVPGLCTTPASFGCDNTHYCEGASTCVAGQCCVQLACPATFCGEIDDGCGGHEPCTAGGNCHAMTLTITSEHPGYPIGILDNTPFSVAWVKPNQVFDLILVRPDGGQETPVHARADSHGNYSGTFAFGFTDNDEYPGWWSAYAQSPYANLWGFSHTAIFRFQVLH